MPVTLACANYGKQFSVPPSRAKNTKTHFCSQLCMSQFNKGDRNPNWKGGLVISQCRNCGAEIRTKLSRAKKGEGSFCSRACQAAWKHANALGYDPAVRVVKQCRVCGKDIFIKPSHAEKAGTYCSRECMAIGYGATLKGESNPNFSGAGQRLCATCGNKFTSYSKAARFCSVKCRANHPEMKALSGEIGRKNIAKAIERNRQIRIEQIHRPLVQSPLKLRQVNMKRYFCVICGKAGWSYSDRKVCSRACSGKLQQNRTIIDCVVCGKKFEVQRSVAENGQKTCSKECLSVLRSISQQGNKSHRWKGGRTSIVLLDRQSLPYQQWRKAVFERDNYTCQLCSERGGRLSAHHIKPYSKHPEYRRTVGNGITLCWPCHTSIKGKEEQYESQFFEITGGIP